MLKKYNVDVFVMGDVGEGKFDFLSEYCEVSYLPRTPDISSTMVRNQPALITSVSSDEVS